VARKILNISFFVLLACITCVAQSSYKRLTPGSSTKADVKGIFGQPVREFSETLSEYKSDQETEQIFVQYERDSGVVARIEAAYADAIKRSSALASMNLPMNSTAWQINSKGRLEEYFSAACVVLTYAGADASSGISRIGYYSRQLFDISSAKLPPSSFGQRPLPNARNASDGSQQPASQRNAGTTNSGSQQPMSQPATAKYEDVVAKASGAMQAADYQNAIRFSQQAVEIDPNRPQAYEIAGIAQLYGLKNLGAGATSMRAAVQRGGSASFAVTHDHDGFFQSYCQGSLYITKQGLSYRSNDGAHSFAVNRADVKQAGLNNLVGANLNSFHIKVNQNNKTRNFNFAPGTFSAAESKFILELLKNP